MAPHSDPNEFVNIEELFMACGGPSFDDYRKNPDKWRKGLEEVWESVDQSTKNQIKRDQLTRQRYSWRGQYRTESLEKIQRIVREEDYSANEIEYGPREVLLDGTNKNGRTEMVIDFWPRWEWELMGRVSTNNDR